MNLKSLYSLFNLDPPEELILETLLLSSPLKASALAKQIKTNRTTVYALLKRLIAQGLVYETMKSGVKLFAIQPYEKIILLIQEKEDKINQAKEKLSLLKNVSNKQKLFQPRIQIYETQRELQQMMNDLLLYDNITVLAYWPILKVVETLGSEFLQEFHKKRIASNIRLRTIWPKDQIPSSKNDKFLKIGLEQKREVRTTPARTDFSLGYAIYKNTVRFISSKKENLGFLIESQELAQTMRGQFELIWQISKPLKDN